MSENVGQISAAPMQPMTRMSYAYTHRDQMPGSQPAFYAATPKVAMRFQMNRDPLIAAQIGMNNKADDERRGSDMIARQKPAPHLRPSPKFARGADQAAFYTQLSLEHLQAQKASKKALRQDNRRTAKEEYIRERQQNIRPSAAREFQHARNR